jgi:hypothetical protein
LDCIESVVSKHFFFPEDEQRASSEMDCSPRAVDDGVGDDTRPVGEHYPSILAQALDLQIHYLQQTMLMRDHIGLDQRFRRNIN